MKKNKYIPFIILFAFIFIFLMCMDTNFGDDLWFKEMTKMDYFKYISSRYNDWSSRILIETMLLKLLQMPKVIWCFLSALMMSFSGLAIAKMFTKFDLKSNCLVAVLVSLYPITNMSDTGWYATSINYLYPLAFCLFALIPIKKINANEKIKKYMYPIYSLITIIACNQEIVCALLFGFYSVFLLYFIKTKKNNKYMYIQLGLILLSLIFILTCPGNSVRTASEIKTWYPEFNQLSIFTKLFLCIVTCVLNVVCNPNLIVLFVVISLPLLSLFKEKKFIYKIISFIPFLIILFANNNLEVFSQISRYANGLKHYLVKVDEIVLCETSIMSLLVALMFVGTIMLTIWRLFNKEKYLLLLIMTAGLMSRMILGFSPTMYASGVRTFIFLDFSLIVILLFIMTSMKKFLKKDSYNIILLLMLLFSLLQLINRFI